MLFEVRLGFKATLAITCFGPLGTGTIQNVEGVFCK
jgi:hypothetical protein